MTSVPVFSTTVTWLLPVRPHVSTTPAFAAGPTAMAMAATAPTVTAPDPTATPAAVLVDSVAAPACACPAPPNHDDT